MTNWEGNQVDLDKPWYDENLFKIGDVEVTTNSRGLLLSDHLAKTLTGALHEMVNDGYGVPLIVGMVISTS